MKIKSTVYFSSFSLGILIFTGALATLSFSHQQWIVGGVFVFFMLIMGIKSTVEKSNVLHSLQVAVEGLQKKEVVPLLVVHTQDKSIVKENIHLGDNLKDSELVASIKPHSERIKTVSQG